MSRDLDEGDIIWLVPQISDKYQLEALHWEVLPLEDSSDKLLAAKTIKRGEFEEALRAKLQPLQGRTACNKLYLKQFHKPKTWEFGCTKRQTVETSRLKERMHGGYAFSNTRWMSLPRLSFCWSTTFRGQLGRLRDLFAKVSFGVFGYCTAPLMNKSRTSAMESVRRFQNY